MAITLEIWEDSGALVGSPLLPTTRQSVNNLGWKNSGLDETYTYVDYPLRRYEPGSPTTLTYSYTKYYYLKMSGTYPAGTRLGLSLQGDPEGAAPAGLIGTDGVQVYYKFTNTYAAPSNSPMSGGTLYTGSLSYTPKLSTTGPESATTTPSVLTADTTYYTEYLVTQLVVQPGAWTDYGNIGEMTLNFSLIEYEGTDY